MKECANTIVASIAIFYTALAFASSGNDLPHNSAELMEILQQEGVSAESILDFDSDGIPLVCGTDSDAGFTELQPAEQTFSSALPANTRGWEVIPGVIRADGLDSFRLEVDTNGPVARVIMDDIVHRLISPEATPFDLRDDGLSEDRVAGDFVFTAGPFRYDTSYPFYPEFYENDPTSPEGLFVTNISFTLDVEELNGTVTQFLLPPEVGILRSDIPEIDMVHLTPDIVVSPHLINIRTDFHATQRFLHVPGTFFIPYLTQRIYEVLPDNFDFFVFFSTDKIEQVPRLTRNNFYAGIHTKAQVNYTGNWLNPYDNSAIYGSSGRLLGLNALDAYTRGIHSNNATHEIIHQWVAFMDPGLGLSQGAHYKSRSSVGSLVGGFLWNDNSDGTFTINCEDGRNGAYRAPPLDKYMMGLIDGSEVSTMRAYSETSLPPVFKCWDGEPVFSDEIIATVLIEDIQSMHGIRSPGPATAQRDFHIGFVAESHNRLLNATEMTFYEILAEHYTKQVPSQEPDPYHGFNWVPVTRFFGERTSWRSDILQQRFTVPVDVKPASCPNPVNTRSKGVLPVAILGSYEFDVTDIDVASIRLGGLAPIRSAIEDVATPYEPLTVRNQADDCTEMGPDNHPDLTFKFANRDVITALQAELGRELDDGEVLVLKLQGTLLDGMPIEGEDVIVILKK